MFNLPPARKIYKCKTKRKEGYGKCDQEIYQDDKRKHRSGKLMVLNAEDGRGGKKGDPHVCPDRLDSEFDHTDRKVNWRHYHWQQMNKMCPSCAQTFNSYKNPLCPTCFRLQCLKCGNIQQWIVLLEGNQTTCFECGNEHFDVIQIWNAYKRNYGTKDYP